MLRLELDVAVALASARTHAEALEGLFDAALQIDGIDAGGLYAHNRTDGSLELLVHRGLSREFVDAVSRLDGQSRQAHAVAPGRPLYFAHPDLAAVDPACRREGIRAMAAIPILHEGDVTAVLNVGSRSRDEIPIDARRALEVIAAQYGNVAARLRAEEAARDATEGLERKIEERTAQLVEANRRLREEIERRQQEEESLRLLSRAVGQSAEGVAVADPDGIVRFANESFARMHGLTPDEVVGRHVSVFHTPDQMQSVGAAMEQVRKAGSFTGEIWHARRDGTVFPTLMRVSLLRDDGGAVIGAVATALDITEQRAANEALRESERRLSTLMANLPGMAYRCRDDRLWTMEFISDGCFDLTGFHPIDLVNNRERAFADLIHPDDRDMVWTTAQEAIRRREPYRLTYRLRTVTGEEKWVWEHGVGIFTADGELTGLEGLITDITERKKAEEKLEQSRASERALRENLAALIAVGNDLVIADTFEELCRRAVEYGRSRLGFDRLGIWWLSEKPGILHGSFGTDEAGQVRDERDRTVYVSPETAQILASQRPGVVLRDDGAPLHNAQGEVVSQGSILRAGIWDGKRVVGLLFVDNLLRHEPMAERDQELAALYASMLGHLASQKRAEEALQQSEAKNRAIVDAIPDMMFRCRRDTLILDFKPARELRPLVPPAQFLGRRMVDVLPADVGELLRATINRAVETGDMEVIEYLLPMEGVLTDFEARIVASGPDEVVIHVRDITKRRQAEQALRESEERYRTLAESAQDLIFIVDREDRVQYVNRFAAEMIGRTPDELLGQVRGTLFPHDVADRQRQSISRVLDTGQPFGEETSIPTPRGDIWLDTHLVPLRRGDGEIYAVLGVARDNTEAKQTEQALREAEERQRTILDQMQEAVIYADADDRIRQINECACSLLGGTRDALLGRDLVEVHDEGIRPKVAEMIRTLRAGNCTQAVSLRRTVDDRELIFRFSPVCGPDGRHQGTIANIIDITEQVRMQQRLAEARQMEAIGTLAGGVAHDFNNLMTTILATASHVKARRRPDHPDYASLAQIEQSATTAGRLAHQLLIYAKGGKILPRLVGFHSVVAQAIRAIEPIVPETIRFEHRVAADLGHVECDITQIEQVVVNLCRNAIDAMPDGGRLVLTAEKVTLAEPREDTYPPLSPGDYVCIAVQDTGIGMDAETADRAFDPFFTTKPNGYGLGLAAAWGTMRSHGGSIGLVTKPGAGSTFRIWLPRVAVGG